MSSRILSSTAERAYWLGRYLERADSTARLVRVNSRLLYDLPKRLPLAWQGLVNIAGSRDLFDELFDEPSEKNVARYLINDARNPGALIRSLDHARENVRTLRGIIPRGSVEYINAAHLYAKEQLSEPLSRTRRTEGLDEIQGAGASLSTNGTLVAEASFSRPLIAPGDFDADGDIDGVDLGVVFATFTGPGLGPPANPACSSSVTR